MELTEMFSKKRLNQYIVIASNGNLSCPIKLSELKKKQRPIIPVIFSSFENIQTHLDHPSICVTLGKLEDQNVIAIDDLPYPQIIFHNFCPATLCVINHDPLKFNKPMIQFTDNWNWSYQILPDKIAHLSFPHSSMDQEDGDTKTIFVVFFTPERLRKSNMNRYIITNT